MKTPDEIKKDALALIRQTDASYRQLSKVLCDKELATLEELLQGASQVKSELKAVKLERDAAVAIIGEYRFCCDCKHIDVGKADEPCRTCLNDETSSKDGWEWRGVCPDTEVRE